MEIDPTNEEHKEYMNFLISEGAAWTEGLDDEGNTIYKFDMDILEEIAPELHAVMQEDIDKILLGLFEKGLVDITYDEDLNAVVAISDEAELVLEEMGFKLDKSESIE